MIKRLSVIPVFGRCKDLRFSWFSSNLVRNVSNSTCDIFCNIRISIRPRLLPSKSFPVNVNEDSSTEIRCTFHSFHNTPCVVPCYSHQSISVETDLKVCVEFRDEFNVVSLSSGFTQTWKGLITIILCITHTVEHNCISLSSTVGIQLHVSALYVGHLEVVI